MRIDISVAQSLGNIIRQGSQVVVESDNVGELNHVCCGHVIGRSKRTHEETMLQTLIAFYDYSTYVHAQRTAYFAEAIARHLQLSDEEVNLAGLAALLHDIGKVIIPQEILQKKGPLTEDDWKIMRLHPEVGQRMLIIAGGVFKQLAPIVIAHHERWDGSGYPAGLRGEEIPTVARILAVVDSYDAITSYRSYRLPLSSQEACSILEDGVGSRYDAQIVATFLKVLNEPRIQTIPPALSLPHIPVITQAPHIYSMYASVVCPPYSKLSA